MERERHAPTAGRATTGPGARDEPLPVVAEDVRKVYGGEDGVTAVDGVSFAVEPGTAVGLLGPNGAGKTTLIKTVLGLIVPTEGRTAVEGVDVLENPRAAYRRVGAMLEGARNVYWRLTVRRNLAFFAAIAGNEPREERARHEALLDQFGLAEKADVPVRELSRGQQQKVSLACTLARDADVLFLDEPTLGLDVESSLELRRELRRLVEDDGITVVLSSHDMDVIEAVCDRVVVMNEGEIIADERVDDLLDVFDARAYEVTAEPPLDAACRDWLRSELDVREFERRGTEVRFRVRTENPDFYGLVDRLEGAGVPVTGLDTVDPDLESVFLDLVDGTRERPAGSGGRPSGTGKRPTEERPTGDRPAGTGVSRRE